jgi:GNAT superfamily N-acetyltransferase
MGLPLATCHTLEETMALLGSAAQGAELRDVLTGSGPICQNILATLPSWFGVPESVREYVEAADRSPAVVASLAGEDVGILVLTIHGPYAAEVEVMAVVPDLHRRGIGRSMLAHAEAALAHAGIEFLQVKTLSSRKPDEGYEKTRAFYFASGFRPLQELPNLWGPDNPALQMIKTVGDPTNSGSVGQRWSLRW